MKANTKYTAGELVTAAFPTLKTEDIFGKLRVRIGGLSGIVKPTHTIFVSPGTKELEVIVGNETASLKFEGDEKEPSHSETAKAVNEAEGKAETKRQQTELAKKAELAKKEEKK